MKRESSESWREKVEEILIEYTGLKRKQKKQNLLEVFRWCLWGYGDNGIIVVDDDRRGKNNDAGDGDRDEVDVDSCKIFIVQEYTAQNSLLPPTYDDSHWIYD